MQGIPAKQAASPERVPVNPAEWALFIDIDGTLLDMAPTPDGAVVPRGLVQALARLAIDFNGAIALITGRRICDADRIFAPLRLVMSGVHGTEARTRPGGEAKMLAAPVPPGMLHAVCHLARLSPGILVEEKGAGLAVHYRQAPEARAALERELGRIALGWGDFTLRDGRKVLELIPKAYSKATGLRSLMQLPAFHHRRPVMIGDDRGDEPAMREAQRLGGIGLRVAGEYFGPDRADFDDTASVRSWLAALAARPSPRAHSEGRRRDTFAPPGPTCGGQQG